MDNNVKKSFWSDAARGGAIIGLAIFLISLISAILPQGGKSIMSILEFAVLAYFIYTLSKRRGMKYGNAGYGYGQSMGFILAMMIFTGIIVGFGGFLITHYIVPVDFDALIEQALEANPMYDPDMPGMEAAAQFSARLAKSPVFQVISGIFGMLIYGGIIGLIASAFVRRRPDIFAGTEDESNN